MSEIALSVVITSGILITKNLTRFRGKRESNLGSENTCRVKTHDRTINSLKARARTVVDQRTRTVPTPSRSHDVCLANSNHETTPPKRLCNHGNSSPGEVCLKKRLPWRKISAENLDCDYVKLFGRLEASALLQECERDLSYFTGKELTRVQVYGKWYDIPRKQVAHGDSGLTYKYSGVTIPAMPWTPLLTKIQDRIQNATGLKFNFVLINRYKDGTDYMGEHRDDEKELVPTSPIASLSLGQERDFVFRHGESRGKNSRRNLSPVKMALEHGSLLMMNHPTNVYWYHSLPVRKKAPGVRINMTFRCLKT